MNETNKPHDDDDMGENEEQLRPKDESEMPRPISDDEFERYQRRCRINDLRFEAGIPVSAVAWWRLRSKQLGSPALSHPDPSGLEHWDTGFCRLREGIQRRAERDVGAVYGLLGTYGTGKTTMASGLLLLATARLMSGLYSSLVNFELEMEGALKSTSEQSRLDVMAGFAEPKLLVLDDCSAAGQSTAGMRLLRELIARRHSCKRDTILVSNDTSEDFVRFLGGAVTDRVHDGGLILELKAKGLRE